MTSSAPSRSRNNEGLRKAEATRAFLHSVMWLDDQRKVFTTWRTELHDALMASDLGDPVILTLQTLYTIAVETRLERDSRHQERLIVDAPISEVARRRRLTARAIANHLRTLEQHALIGPRFVYDGILHTTLLPMRCLTAALYSLSAVPARLERMRPRKYSAVELDQRGRTWCSDGQVVSPAAAATEGDTEGVAELQNSDMPRFVEEVEDTDPQPGEVARTLLRELQDGLSRLGVKNRLTASDQNLRWMHELAHKVGETRASEMIGAMTEPQLWRRFRSLHPELISSIPTPAVLYQWAARINELMDIMSDA